jgi:serine/threonine-protein kinase
MIGKILGGRYRITQILATGGFSETYVAEDIHRPHYPKCVVKHLKPASSEYGVLESARRLFKSEAETLEQLGKNEQIPTLYAYFEENQEFYLVQEFINGNTLSEELIVGQPWHENQVVQLLQEILGILVFVHSHGLIHRDIKPSNLMRRKEDNRLVLIDFGSVKQAWMQVATIPEQTGATIAIGTPGYMPTEQGRGKPRPSSDIYALGIIAIQALTGLHPSHLEEDVETGELLWQHQAAISNLLAPILTKMVRYHFKERYQTAAEALQALQQIVNREKINSDTVVTPLPRSTPLTPDPSQKPTPVTLLNSALQVTATNNSPQLTVLSSPTLPVPPLDTAAKPEVKTTNQLSAQKQQKHHPTWLRQPAHLWFGAGIIAVLMSMVAGYAVFWQPRAMSHQAIEQLQALKNQGKHQECANQNPTLPQDSVFFAQAQAIIQECQLAQAQELASDRRFQAAIAAASKIPQDAANYQQAQHSIEQWSDAILNVAQNQYQSGNLNAAIAIAQVISASSPLYSKSQAAIASWQQEWQQNTAHWQAAQKALEQKNWQTALDEVAKIASHSYWQTKVKPIVNEAETQIAATKPTPQATRTTMRSPSTSTSSSVNTSNRTATRPHTTRQPTRTAAARTTTRTSRQPRASAKPRTATKPTTPARTQPSGWKVEIR